MAATPAFEPPAGAGASSHLLPGNRDAVLEKAPTARGTARFGCLRRFCLSTHSESFGVIRWPECDCVCAGVGLSGGRGRLLTHVHRASACTLNAVGLLPVSGRGDARVAPPCPTTLCVWRNLPYLTLPSRAGRSRELPGGVRPLHCRPGSPVGSAPPPGAPEPGAPHRRHHASGRPSLWRAPAPSLSHSPAPLSGGWC